MEYRKLPINRGWYWVKQGFALYKKSAILWVTLTMIGIMGLMAVASIPVIGEPLSTILFPVFYGGLLLGCFALARGEELELAHLFAGFQHHTQRLVTLDGMTLVAQLLILGLMKISGGAMLADLMMSGEPISDPAIFTQAIEAAGAAIFIGLLLFSALLFATQFAPMLVIFGNLKPAQALTISAWLCLKNMGALTMYGLIMMSFALLASMPMMLGWLILLPLMITSTYSAFRDMVNVEAGAAATENTPENPDQNLPSA